MEVNIVMKNRYLNFSILRLKAGLLAILLISATAVAPVKARWLSDTVSSLFSSLFSTDTDSNGPKIVLTGIIAAGISAFFIYNYFKKKKNPNQNTTPDETNSDEESAEETPKEDEQTDTEQSNDNKEENPNQNTKTDDQSGDNNTVNQSDKKNKQTSPDTFAFTCSDEEYLENSTTRFSDTVPGKELQITDDASVVQFLVFNQNTTRTNHDGNNTHVTGDDSCGYHALKNGEHLLKYENDKISQFPNVREISKAYGSLENSLCLGGGDMRKDTVKNRKEKQLQKIVNAFDKIITIKHEYNDNKEYINQMIKKIIKHISSKLVTKVENQKISVEISADILKAEMLKQTTNDIYEWIINNCIDFNNTNQPITLLPIVEKNQHNKEKKESKNNILIETRPSKKGESLYAEELHGLIDKGCNTKELYGKKEQYTVIENMDLLLKASKSKDTIPFLNNYDRNIIKKIYTMQDNIQNDISFSHAFIINTGGIIGQNVGTYGHFFTMVIHNAKDRRTYEIADSKNILRLYGDRKVKDLITMIEGKQVAQKLILPKEERKQFKQEIISLLQQTPSSKKNIDLPEQTSSYKQPLDHMSLATRYGQWGGKSLSPEIQEQIVKKYFSY